MKRITKDMVTFKIVVDQDQTPVRGNVADTGDSRWDTHIENGILEALDLGNTLAWGTVTVTASFFHLEAKTTVYQVRCPGGYAEFNDMVLPAMEEKLLRMLNWRASELVTELGIEDNINGTTPNRVEMIVALMDEVKNWDHERLVKLAADVMGSNYNAMSNDALLRNYRKLMEG